MTTEDEQLPEVPTEVFTLWPEVQRLLDRIEELERSEQNMMAANIEVWAKHDETCRFKIALAAAEAQFVELSKTHLIVRNWADACEKALGEAEARAAAAESELTDVLQRTAQVIGDSTGLTRARAALDAEWDNFNWRTRLAEARAALGETQP